MQSEGCDIFEERKNLLNSMVKKSPAKSTRRRAQRTKRTQVRIERIEARLQASQQDSWRRRVVRVRKIMSKPCVVASARRKDI
jgi:hypothetical protein